MSVAANCMCVLERRVCGIRGPSAGRGERSRGSSCYPCSQGFARAVDKFSKSAILSGSNQVLPDCILNQFCIAPNVKHFHNSIFVKSDGAGGNV